MLVGQLVAEAQALQLLLLLMMMAHRRMRIPGPDRRQSNPGHQTLLQMRMQLHFHLTLLLRREGCVQSLQLRTAAAAQQARVLSQRTRRQQRMQRLCATRGVECRRWRPAARGTGLQDTRPLQTRACHWH